MTKLVEQRDDLVVLKETRLLRGRLREVADQRSSGEVAVTIGVNEALITVS